MTRMRYAVRLRSAVEEVGADGGVRRGAKALEMGLNRLADEGYVLLQVLQESSSDEAACIFTYEEEEN